jgi:hypothetical protein
MQIPLEPGGNPFAVLSFIVAPAILTNASSVLAMSTSNRLARVVDRARELSKQLDTSGDDSPDIDRRLRELSDAETRALMLIQALRSFYLALGAFSSAALLSVIGAVLISLRVQRLVLSFEIVAAVAGSIAVIALVQGCALLVRETRIAVQGIRIRAAGVRERIARRQR